MCKGTQNAEAMVEGGERLIALGGDMEVLWCLMVQRDIKPTLKKR